MRIKQSGRNSWTPKRQLTDAQRERIYGRWERENSPVLNAIFWGWLIFSFSFFAVAMAASAIIAVVRFFFHA